MRQPLQRVVVIVCIWMSLLPSPAWAAGRRAYRPHRELAADTLFYGPVTGPGTRTSARPWIYYRGAYPRYFGGFHARELQNLGVPPGDVGLRGNGWTWSPW